MFGCKTILSRLLGRLERVSVGNSNRIPMQKTFPSERRKEIVRSRILKGIKNKLSDRRGVRAY